MTGRPSSYTPEIGEEICERIATTDDGIANICREEGMPSQATVYRWLESDEAFREMYERARARQMERFADDIVRISDDGSNDTYLDDEGNRRTDHDVIARSKLRVDTRKWLMSKLAPKKYGDKITTEHTGKDGGPIEVSNARERLASRIAELAAKRPNDHRG